MPPRDLRIYKNGIEQWRPQPKDDSLQPLWTSYTMPAALLKMDHPCFLDFFGLNHADGGFRPRGGLFYPFRSADTFAGPRDDFYAGHTADRWSNSRSGLESSAGKCKKQHRTIGIGVEAIAKWTCLRSCKHPEDGVGLYLSVGLPAVCGSSNP